MPPTSQERIVALEAQLADLLASGARLAPVAPLAVTPSRTVPAIMSSLIGVDNFLTASNALTPDQLELASNSMFSTEDVLYRRLLHDENC